MKVVRRRKLSLAALFFSASFALSACDNSATPALPTSTSSSVQPATTSSPNLTRVRLGYVPVMVYAPLFVAIERGYFAQEGIEASLTPVQGGSDSVVQLASGNFDVAAGGVGAGLFNAVSWGVKFKIVAPMHSERPPLTSPL